MTNGTVTIAYNDIANDVTIEHQTRQLSRVALEREIRYILTRAHPTWIFVNYAFDDMRGTMFPWRKRLADCR